MSEQAQGPGWWQASDGRWYPPQPQQPGGYASSQGYGAAPVAQKKKGHGCLYAALGGAVVIVLIVVVAVVVVDSAAKKVSTNIQNNNLGGSAPAAKYKVGDTAVTGGYRVTVFAVKDPQPPADQFSTPRAGDHFVSVDVQVTNPGTDQKSFSSLLEFHLLDSLNHQYVEALVTGLSPGPPDGEIAGGQSIRGFVGFEVPDGTTGLKLRVQGGLTAAGAVFNL